MKDPRYPVLAILTSIIFGFIINRLLEEIGGSWFFVVIYVAMYLYIVLDIVMIGSSFLRPTLIKIGSALVSVIILFIITAFIPVYDAIFDGMTLSTLLIWGWLGFDGENIAMVLLELIFILLLYGVICVIQSNKARSPSPRRH